MIKISKQSNCFIVLVIVFIILIGVLLPVGQTASIKNIKGFDKGASYTSVVPIEKVTFVNFDEDTLLDDYAYLAAVPTTIFKYDDKIVSHPLMFYQDKMKYDDDKYRSLDAYTGIEYFMEDWEDYCYQLDQMTLINIDESKVNQWKAKDYVSLKGDNPYEVASNIALKDWAYSDDAVIAVINEEFQVPNNKVSNKFEGILPANDINKERKLTIKQTNSLNPVSKTFEVGNEYKQIKAEAWWDGVLIAGIMIPTGDPDLQLSFQKDDKWMQAVATADWNIFSPAGHEFTQAYVYQPGTWRISITDFPTESEAPRKGIPGLFEIQGSLLGLFRRQVKYNVDITLFPGVDVKIPDTPTFGIEDAKFKLTWDNPNVNLGFSLLGPSGEAIYTEINESRTDYQEIYIERLGECLPDESYSISVFATTDVSDPLKFNIEYTWKQVVPKEKADALTSATEGAVLASTMNAPLLYTNPFSLADETNDALYKLGVENVYIVDVGSYLSNDAHSEIKEIVSKITSFKDYMSIYDKIREMSGNNDVIFTTIDPWTYWYAGELEPAGETEAALYIGPAAYIAAHHGSPVIIIENHPRLSSAATWHNEFWRRFSAIRYEKKPSVAEMVLTGTRIYHFLKEFGFDKEGKESIITVAGQYDIGIPWDRIFPGVANSGRFCGTPVDTSTWISRSVFYPAMIYANPALQGQNELITGSISTREGFRGLLKKPLLNTMVIQRESREEKFEFPVLCSFVTHKHRFNERASQYYGAKYQCADGLIPGETTTMEAIDQGVNLKYYNQEGMYFPDIAESEVVPFYLEKGGFDTVFSTELESVVHDLNQGVILWIHASHGGQSKCGQTLFWDPAEAFHIIPNFIARFTGAMKEKNPWRGYDWLLGSTQEPDTMSMDMQGFLPFTNHKSLIIPATGMDYVLARKPLREFLVNRPFLGNFFSRFINVDNLYDGVTGSISFSKEPLDWKTSIEIEENLGNIHSVGFITSICQTSNTYLQLALIRHGSVFQVQDPWPTSWYGAVWRQSIPRDIILGNTVGEAYTRGISHVGILYLGGGINDEPQWWWDDAENVVYFGDPDIRMFVPENEYSSANYWERPKSVGYDEELNLYGHTPFGAISHPNAKSPQTFLEKYLWLIGIIVLIAILLIAIAAMGRKKR